MSKQLVYIHTKSPAVRKEDEKAHTTGFKDGDQRVGSSEHVCETEMVQREETEAETEEQRFFQIFFSITS